MPNRADTSLGGDRGAFPETAWSVVARLGTPGSYREAIERLCTRYWKPVYRYIRLAWAKSNEDAKDLAQAFFTWILEDEVLRKYAPERGGFRRYLKVVLKGFLGHQEEARQRLKRGGGVKIVALETAVDEPVAEPDPEKAFDQAWLNDVVRQSMDRVREAFASSGRGNQWKAFEAYDLTAGEPPTYAELAARLDVKATDVRNWLFAVREAVRDAIRAELAETTSSESELDDEWRELFGA
jgi:RNA polymerase sigma-70 factor (ECF subfamily)